MRIRGASLAVGLGFLLAPSLAFASFDTSIGIGARGDTVISLQQFLIAQGLLSSSATGYFGNLTRAAVQSFQKKHGINTTGFFGPLTRAAVNAVGTTATPSVPASAPLPSSTTITMAAGTTTTSGTAPLTISVTASDALRHSWPRTYFNFGDTTYDTCSLTTCSHTYNLPGVYTAALTGGDDNGNDHTLTAVIVTVLPAQGSGAITINAPSLIAYCGPLIIKGSAINASNVHISAFRMTTAKSTTGDLAASATVPVLNGLWSYTFALSTINAPGFNGWIVVVNPVDANGNIDTSQTATGIATKAMVFGCGS